MVLCWSCIRKLLKNGLCLHSSTSPFIVMSDTSLLDAVRNISRINRRVPKSVIFQSPQFLALERSFSVFIRIDHDLIYLDKYWTNVGVYAF